METEVILEVKNLSVTFCTELGAARAVDDVSFTLRRGETLGIVGESGCGKSVTSLAIMRLLPQPAGRITGGQILFRGTDITKLKRQELYGLRGNRIAMIFQEPMTSLNPLHTVGAQLTEVFSLHFPTMSEQEKYAEAIKMLEKVGIPEPEKRYYAYPHQLSGGMRQRVMIAMALACKPDILIADEPTTALDVTIQAQILELIRDLQQEYGMSVIFITHDLGVIAQVCKQVLVMYAGRSVEYAPIEKLFANPLHPYTKGLLASIPTCETPHKTELPSIPGMVPGIFDMPQGCRFQNRCAWKREQCEQISPPLDHVGDGRLVSCHRWKEIADSLASKTEDKSV